MADQVLSNILNEIGDIVEDASEETFVLFSQDLPPNDLGIHDDKASSVDLEINGKEYTICQSSSLLRSARPEGTTGAMMWKVTPRVAAWLADFRCILWKKHIMKSSMVAVELGCGVAGLIGLVLSPLVATYVLTDQVYVLKYLRDNIASNTHSLSDKRKLKDRRGGSSISSPHSPNLQVVPLDWEHDSVENLQNSLHPGTDIDLLLLCDCIYNTYLVRPLVQVCADVCQMNASKTTVVLIAQQVRTDDVFEEWLSTFLESFLVWRIKDELLPPTLQSTSGYVVHLALLR